MATKLWKSAERKFYDYYLKKYDKKRANKEIEYLNEFFDDLNWSKPQNFSTVNQKYNEVTQEFKKQNDLNYKQLDNNKKYNAFRQCVIFARDYYKCKYCTTDFHQIPHLEVDHIHGKGDESKENLNTSCVFCNRAKKDWDLEVFEVWLNHIKNVNK